MLQSFEMFSTLDFEQKNKTKMNFYYISYLTQDRYPIKISLFLNGSRLPFSVLLVSEVAFNSKKFSIRVPFNEEGLEFPFCNTLNRPWVK